MYLLSCFTGIVSPEKFSFFTLLSIGYLIILPIYLLCAVAWLFYKRKVGVILLLLSLAGWNNFFDTAGTNFSYSTALHAKDTASFRVASWNINEFLGDQAWADTPGNPRRKMLEAIKNFDADVLCLQDMIENWSGKFYLSNIDAVMAAAGYTRYHFVNYERHNSGVFIQKYGAGIFTRLPVTDTGSISMGQIYSPENAAWMDVVFKGKPLRVYVAHFVSMNLWPNTEGQGGINYLSGDSTELRTMDILHKLAWYGRQHAIQAKLIKEHMKGCNYPLVFCGDLNSVPSSYPYQHLKKGLKDVFLEKGFSLGGTYNRVFPKLRIDVILNSPQLEPTDYFRPA